MAGAVALVEPVAGGRAAAVAARVGRGACEGGEERGRRQERGRG